MTQKHKILLIAVIVVEFFNGLSGIAGGIGLILDPSAASLGMELEWLNSTPFTNYLIPGIILLLFNGCGNIFAGISALKKQRYSAYIALFFGLVMMIWIITQVGMIGYKSFLQPLYFFTGLLQTLLGRYFIRLGIHKDK